MNRALLLLGGWLLCVSSFAMAEAPDKSCPIPDSFTDLPIGDERGRVDDLSETGDGVVVCRDQYDNLMSIELFGYWEQRTKRQVFHRSPKTSDPIDSAKKVLNVVRKFSPQRARAYETFIDGFMEQVQWTNIGLSRINDVCPELMIPNGCSYDQLIVRRNLVSAPDKLFLINKQLWDAMVVAYQGGAILHEAFYDEAIRAGHTNSRMARYFGVLMHSKSAEKFTDFDYAQKIKDADFPFWEFHQAFQRSIEGKDWESFTDEQLHFDSNNALISIDARENARLELFHPSLSLKADEPDSRGAHYSLFVKQIKFSHGPEGDVVRAVLEKKAGLGNPYVILNGQRVELPVPSEIVILPDSSLRVPGPVSGHSTP